MKVKALRDLYGSYKSFPEGTEKVLKDSLAKELIDAGLAEKVSDEQPEEETEEKEPEPAKSSIKITGGNKGKVKE